MNDLGLRQYLHILRRRLWIVLLAVVVVPAAAVALALRQSPLYESSADVLLHYQSLPSSLSGVNDPNTYAFYIDPAQVINTSLQVAGLPIVTQRVAAALRRSGVTTVGSMGAYEVGNTNLIRFTSTAGNPGVSAATATAYAREFTRYYEQLDTQAITQAINGLRKRVADLQSQGTAAARQEALSLQSKISQLETLMALQTSTATVVREASGAAKIRPTPRKYGILGIGLGLVLGVGLAFLRDAFDTRLRSSADIGAALKLPLLGRIPPPPRRVEREHQLVMLGDPTGTGADACRRLRMNLEFASIGKPAQVVMVTSALPKEGKSTTVANLGVAMALAGKSVALVDLDLHRPMLSRFFRLDGAQQGMTGVVLGLVSVDEALVEVRPDGRGPDALGPSRNGHVPANGVSAAAAAARSNGSLVVLPTGALPPDPGEFVGLEGVRHVVAALRERFDAVLIDVPPLLALGDGLTIAGFSDAVMVVVRSDLAKRPIEHELAAMLSRMPAVKLGFVLCGDSGLETKSYVYGQYGYEASELSQEEVFR